MERNVSLVRYTPLRKSNPERRAKLFARNFHSAEFVKYTKDTVCKTCGRVPSASSLSECSHAETRGSGADYTRVFPQCGACHRAYGRNRTQFLSEMRITQDDIDRYVDEHQSAWRMHMERVRG